jgi:hypothetical protein
MLMVAVSHPRKETTLLVFVAAQVSTRPLYFAARCTYPYWRSGYMPVCNHAGMLDMSLPIFIMGPVMQTIGSKFAAEWTCGWSYRMCERWALDGCGPLNDIHTKMLRNNGTNGFTMFLWIVAGAVVSPTSVLRMLTGVTLVCSCSINRAFNHHHHGISTIT